MISEDKYSLAKDLSKREVAALLWLKRSMDQCGGQGSSMGYSRIKKPISGWFPAYPETTGYLLPTLWNYYDRVDEKWILDYVLSAAEWLLTLQFDSGAFPGGLEGSKKASVFNSAMILLGLSETFCRTHDERYGAVVGKTLDWLLSTQNSQGGWQDGHYYQYYDPSYYTRVIWAILLAANRISYDDVRSDMMKQLEHYSGRFLSNGMISHCGFTPTEQPFSHSLTYAIRGFLESSVILGHDEILSKTKESTMRLLDVYQIDGRIAGSYDKNWQGDLSFTCVPGNFQIVGLLLRWYQITGDPVFLEYALQIMEYTRSFQDLNPKRINTYGSFPGSQPIWQKYMRFIRPNWAVKFFLDATMQLKTLE